MIHAKVTKALQKAFDGKLSDVVNPFLLKREIKKTYNESTDTYDAIYDNYTSRGIKEDYGTKEILANEEIKAGDLKLIIIADEISTVPRVDDMIMYSDVQYIVTAPINVFDITFEVSLRGT